MGHRTGRFWTPLLQLQQRPIARRSASAALSRNPNFKARDGINAQVAADQRVFPSRVTPGVGRGYREGQLVEGKLAQFTAACGPMIYRGDLFRAEFRGSSFVAEPAANLIKHNAHVERDGTILATITDEHREFLTSTSERFRPVNLYNGPDGALYVIDMARGVISHATYLTPWLRRQILDRKLEEPLNQGRIWRIVPLDAPRRAKPNLSRAEPAALVRLLASANGWTRDTAQRLLVEEATKRWCLLWKKWRANVRTRSPVCMRCGRSRV